MEHNFSDTNQTLQKNMYRIRMDSRHSHILQK